LSGAYTTRIFNKQAGNWHDLPTDFSRAVIKNIFDIEVPVIAKDELIFYKKIIAREVDLIDVEQIIANDVT